jgi:hypothetical protein
MLRQWADDDEVSTAYERDMETSEGAATMAMNEWHMVEPASDPYPSADGRRRVGVLPQRTIAGGALSLACSFGPSVQGIVRSRSRAGFSAPTLEPLVPEIIETSQLPIYNHDYDDAYRDTRRSPIKCADAMLFATPERDRSMRAASAR